MKVILIGGGIIGLSGVEFERYRAGLAIVAKTEKSYRFYRRLAESRLAADFRSEVRGIRGAEIAAFDPAIRPATGPWA